MISAPAAVLYEEIRSTVRSAGDHTKGMVAEEVVAVDGHHQSPRNRKMGNKFKIVLVRARRGNHSPRR
jgi:hypothetical protein